MCIRDRLDVVADAAHEVAGAHRAVGDHALAPAVGPLEGKDGIGKRGQGCARVDAHGLLRLEAQRLPGTGRDLPHHGQGTLRLRLRGLLRVRVAPAEAALAADINRADGVAIDGRLWEARQRLVRLDLLGTLQTQSVGDGDPHRLRRDRRIGDKLQLLFHRTHSNAPPFPG